jgi:hypothetical protein
MAESDKERLSQKFQDYLHFEADTLHPTKLKGFLTDCAVANSQLGQVLNNTDSVRFMKLLVTFKQYYLHDAIFSVKWIRENIHVPTGGVSNVLHITRVNVRTNGRLSSSSSS